MSANKEQPNNVMRVAALKSSVSTTTRAVLVLLGIGLLAISLTACGVMPVDFAGGGETMRYEEISSQELWERLQCATLPVVIDVREPNETAQGYIRGARLIPLGSLADKLGELDPESEIVVVCRSGRRSAQAAAILVRKGFTSVYNLTGGMLDWKHEVVK